ncbi:MAG: hypothetical protein KKE20_05925 [Nanoarchaeota archaeon]|nr:hypothetical protein [Nanoarchaeota archaeon]
MHFRQYSREDLEAFFRANLALDDRRAKNYVTGVLVRFVDKGSFGYVFSDNPLSAELYKLWESPDKAKAFDAFRDNGDAILWLCGFFPGSLAKEKSPRGTKQRFGMGLRWYVDKGRYAYNSAIDLGNEIRVGGSQIETLSSVSGGFEDCSRAILEMRVRVNEGAADFRPGIIKELSDVFYKGEDAARRIAEITGRDRPMLKVVTEPTKRYSKKFGPEYS